MAEQVAGDCDLGHLENSMAGIGDDLRADLRLSRMLVSDQLSIESGKASVRRKLASL